MYVVVQAAFVGSTLGVYGSRWAVMYMHRILRDLGESVTSLI